MSSHRGKPNELTSTEAQQARLVHHESASAEQTAIALQDRLKRELSALQRLRDYGVLSQCSYYKRQRKLISQFQKAGK